MNCPSEFVMAPSGNACILPCPSLHSFKLSSEGTILKCVYSGNKEVSAQLNPVPMYQGEAASYLTLPNKDVYQAEVTRFNNEMTIANGKIDKHDKVRTAFKELEDAENIRDQAPDSYQQARISYYTLVKGDTWLHDEKRRIARVEAQPTIDQYVRQYQLLQDNINQQRSTLDVVTGVKDKVLSVEDDLRFSVSAFERQIDNIRNQMNMDKKKQIETAQQSSSWFDTLLNWLIVAATLVAIITVVRYIMRRRTAFSTPAYPPT